MPPTNAGLSDRQSSLNLDSFDSAIIIGVGGIGAWMALDCALSMCFKKIYLFDPDKIEDSNLNRTPFRTKDIGSYKVDALFDLILERRVSCNVYPFAERFNNESDALCHDRRTATIVFDCRDNMYQDIDYSRYLKVWKLGYDGLSLTIDGDPKNTTLFGDANTYSVTPSFLCPSQLIANIVLCHTLVKNPLSDVLSKKYITAKKLDSYGWLNSKFTFDSSNILEDLFIYNNIKEYLNSSLEETAQNESKQNNEVKQECPQNV